MPFLPRVLWDMFLRSSPIALSTPLLFFSFVIKFLAQPAVLGNIVIVSIWPLKLLKYLLVLDLYAYYVFVTYVLAVASQVFLPLKYISPTGEMMFVCGKFRWSELVATPT